MALKANLCRTSTSTAYAADLLSGHQQQPQQPPQTNQLQQPNAKEPENKFVERVVSIRDKIEQAWKDHVVHPWALLSIYRIPHYLKDGEDRDYIPQIVSLGPYHHDKMWLHPMQHHKLRSLHCVLERTGHDITIYLDSVKNCERKARACYEGQILLGSNEFIEMMVLDGCFILELFQGVKEGFESLGYHRSDSVFSMRGSMHSIRRDMIMLENQIPMFILNQLLKIQLGDRYKKGMVAELALRFFEPLKPTDRRFEATFDPLLDYRSGLHCLEVFRMRLLSSYPRPAPRKWQRSNSYQVADKREQQLIRCVTELKEAGIKVKERQTDQFWDIRFEKGVLCIPRLLIHDSTRSLFLNLIAFEQCHLDCFNEVTSYVVFMDNLINSPKDVAYLHSHGIIDHWLWSDAEVADLFNQLCQEVVFDINNSHISTVSTKVNEEVKRYYKHRWNAWRASLERNYFSSPWSIISVIAAVVLLLLTLAQTFYAVYGYYRSAGS